MTEELRQDIERCLAIYERVIGTYASRTRNMISDHGEIEAISRLMLSGEAQFGFKKLRKSGHENELFESIVLRHQNEFRPEVVEQAQWRLDNADSLPDATRA